MTLPFENDTNAVVKKLAKQNIKANHRTALSIMSAILIAATFMCTLCSLVQSYWNQRVQQEIFEMCIRDRYTPSVLCGNNH